MNRFQPVFSHDWCGFKAASERSRGGRSMTWSRLSGLTTMKLYAVGAR
jgi:hypothetical protein